MCKSQITVILKNVKCSEVKTLSRVRLFAIPWTVAYQDPPSMGFSRQEYWSGLPFPSPIKKCTQVKIYMIFINEVIKYLENHKYS